MKRIFIGGLLLSALGLIACNDKLDIQTVYDYQLTTWPLPGTIKTGEPVEIRFTLTREGDYRETEYFVS